MSSRGDRPRVAYFSMEIAIEAAIPTYSGGLGVLAGDTLKAAADLGVPMIGVTLLHRQGYFKQRIDEHGRQHEEAVHWNPAEHLREVQERVSVLIDGRMVRIRAWRLDLHGATGAIVPVLFLDADLPENEPADRELTGTLYGGDHRYRLRQELVLGVGGVRCLRALGLAASVEIYHMNEGHAALLAGELLRHELEVEGKTSVDTRAVDEVRRRCVFTTHTPVAAGHDRFPLSMAREVIGHQPALERSGLFDRDGDLHMTYAALNLSKFTNAVSRRHAEVSREMFPGREIAAITNGVHPGTWVSRPMAELYDRRLPGWREESTVFRGAMTLPEDELVAAHSAAKRDLIANVKRLTGVELRTEALTLVFARRATGYKRADLVLTDPARLERIAREKGPVQIVFGGKAHPRDGIGKSTIERIVSNFSSLRETVPIAYVPEYDMDLAKVLVAGADVWLNNPEPPLEASGTSGMKAAMNGVPQVSTLDGWWLEGCVEGVTGWSIQTPRSGANAAAEAASLYDVLEQKILPTFHSGKWTDVMRGAISLNGSYFSTHRMLREYVTRAYFS